MTYTPKTNDIKGKIRVRTKNTSYRVLYDDNQRKDYINEFIQAQQKKNPTIRIRDLTFENKNLKFAISDFYKLDLKTKERVKKGNIIIRIKIMDSLMI